MAPPMDEPRDRDLAPVKIELAEISVQLRVLSPGLLEDGDVGVGVSVFQIVRKS
jgi:hypothetical protein